MLEMLVVQQLICRCCTGDYAFIFLSRDVDQKVFSSPLSAQNQTDLVWSRLGPAAFARPTASRIGKASGRGSQSARHLSAVGPRVDPCSGAIDRSLYRGALLWRGDFAASGRYALDHVQGTISAGFQLPCFLVWIAFSGILDDSGLQFEPSGRRNRGISLPDGEGTYFLAPERASGSFC